MATRDKTPTFLRFKDEYKNSRPRNFNERDRTNQPLMHGDAIQLQPIGVAPQWIRIHDIEANISRIKVKMEELSKFHQQSITNFDADGDDSKIDILTDGIASVFKQTHRMIKELGNNRDLTAEEVKVKKNIQSAMSSKLQELSQTFRKKQRNYLNLLQKNATTYNWLKNGQQQEEISDEEEEFRQIGFTKEQIDLVDEMEEQVMSRDREIKKIVKSINDLSTLLQDISILVIQQGTIFDQIEYNLEQTETSLVGANKELVETDNLHKSYRSRLFITMVFVAIIKAFI
ncbi:t-SNARE family protein [Cavenderia fasciculata]|uniref:t-SNARE family protein n=1 Tax=Cavenderia fasciculata TaxID=261658 RepID=F4PTY4_CACFS|nr:t-SNARE family protein [Cavenderia fasciculata]EGG21752.1 t-SNARE family protein [Cavenderia fasciculata]|eukprot:XP_004359602.1 t-SNARE family protein [Cavenderia fasciculata]